MLKRNTALAAALLAAVVTVTGCLERAERLTIRPDGSAYIELNYRSESLSEIYEGDAVPTPGGGWAVEERESESRDLKTKYELHAVRVVDASSPLPSSYAVPGEEESSQALQFPTALVMESRGGAMYYHFHRTYEPRRWAYVQLKKRELIEEPLKALEGKEQSDLSEAEKAAVLRGFAMFEVEKTLIFAREAHLSAASELPQDWWLVFEMDLRSMPDAIDYADLIKVLEAEDDESGEAFRAETERWQEEVDARVEKSARDLLHYSPGQFNRFLAEFKKRKNEYAVSEDLADDVFKITVDMPGKIIASNASDISGAAAKWEFSGQQLHDNAVELMVTSVVGN